MPSFEALQFRISDNRSNLTDEQNWKLPWVTILCLYTSVYINWLLDTNPKCIRICLPLKCLFYVNFVNVTYAATFIFHPHCKALERGGIVSARPRVAVVCFAEEWRSVVCPAGRMHQIGSGASVPLPGLASGWRVKGFKSSLYSSVSSLAPSWAA